MHLTALLLFVAGVYHEASCPSVDKTRMTRMTRTAAISGGLLPAVDCHPEARVKFLGVSPGTWGLQTAAPVPPVEPQSDEKTVRVRAHQRGDEWIDEHTRRPPRRD